MQQATPLSVGHLHFSEEGRQIQQPLLRFGYHSSIDSAGPPPVFPLCCFPMVRTVQKWGKSYCFR